MTQAIVRKTLDFVKRELSDAEGGHDWFHTERVWKMARRIAEEEHVNGLVVELAALLHDIADPKFHDGNQEIGPRTARVFLSESGVDEDVITHVEQIVKHISFKGGNQPDDWTSPELFVVRDADRLDAIGAIGIARAFNYGGYKGRALYDPSVKPDLSMTVGQYRKSTAPTINHFYEKLLLLRDRLHTSTARRIAEERHLFMEQFLHRFYAEWESED